MPSTLYEVDFSHVSAASAGAAGSSTGTGGTLLDVAGGCAAVVGGKLVLTSTNGNASYPVDLVVLPSGMSCADQEIMLDFTYTTGDAPRCVVFRKSASGCYIAIFDTGGFIVLKYDGSGSLLGSFGSVATPVFVSGNQYRAHLYCFSVAPGSACGFVFDIMSLTGSGTPVETFLGGTTCTDGSSPFDSGVIGLTINGSAPSANLSAAYDRLLLFNLAASSTGTAGGSSQAYEFFKPDGLSDLTPAPLVVWVHSAGQSQVQLRGSGGAPLLRPWIDAGFRVVCSNLHGDNWGNTAAQADISDVVTALAATHATSALFIYGLSMGGLASTLAVMGAGTSPTIGGVRVRALALVCPVLDLAYAHDTEDSGGFAAGIEAAFGGSGGYTAALATHDPMAIAAGNSAALNGVPVRGYISTDDSTVPPVHNWTPFAAEVVAPGKLERTFTGGHTPLSSYAPDQGADVVAFFLGSVTSVLYDWFVLEEEGGSIDWLGNYVAPETAGTYHVAAVKASDPSQVGIAVVTVS